MQQRILVDHDHVACVHVQKGFFVSWKGSYALTAFTFSNCGEEVPYIAMVILSFYFLKLFFFLTVQHILNVQKTHIRNRVAHENNAFTRDNVHLIA